MPKAFVRPRCPKQRTHDACAKDDMLLAIGTVHVLPAQIADVVKGEGKPKPWVPWKAEEPSPPPGNQQWMQ
ncbi:MAG: hypothetical protein K2X35_17775 [Bryobacteraceae bacterium]|nr:hypothetical protein [Bryobacteraceae bacterium]